MLLLGHQRKAKLQPPRLDIPPVPSTTYLGTPANTVGPWDWPKEGVQQLQGLGYGANPALIPFLQEQKKNLAGEGRLPPSCFTQ